MYANQFNRYKTDQYTSNNQGKLIVMMYDGAIRFIKEAINGIKNKDKYTQATYLSKAEKIISELKITLDMEKGGEIAKNLERLYNYIAEKILFSNLHGKVEPLEEVVLLLVDLRSAWDQISKAPVQPMAQANTSMANVDAAPVQRKSLSVRAY
ncbi:MAG: flagellar export chaperone FliS [Nitrospinae bacterium]|nr:flagellar export chaperone FliS [Nitrospinota bacterium]